MRKNVELNKLSNIQVCAIALSDSIGKVDFFADGIDSSSGRAHLAINETSGKIQVTTSKGDTLIDNGSILKPDVIKIDVEGAEHLVVNGLDKALSQCRVLFCEVHPRIKQYGSSGDDLQRTLENHGFTIEKIQNRDENYILVARKVTGISLN